MKISVPPELKEAALEVLKQAAVAAGSSLLGRALLLLRKLKK